MKQTSCRRLTRREVLDLTAKLTLGALVLATTGCAKTTMLCSDPARLTDAENSLRESLSYTERSQDDTQQCRGCSFFKASSGSGCGECSIMNGPVNALGHCTSWAAAG